MRIFDCFTFYNELDLLEIRLRELYDKVDQFVIVEASTTFTNRPKPFILKENFGRFDAWSDKIRLISTDLPGHSNPWTNETAQRDTIMQALTDAERNDIVIVSDVDEIPRPCALDLIRNSDQSIWPMRMALFNFKFNYMRASPNQYDVWAMATRAKTFEQISPNTLRSLRFDFFNTAYQYQGQGIEVVEHAGWHFGYLGDNAYLRDKAQSFSHSEMNTAEFLAHIDIETSIAQRKEWNRAESARYEIVQLDDYFPRTITSDPAKYRHYILDNPDTSAYNILPPYPYR